MICTFSSVGTLVRRRVCRGQPPQAALRPRRAPFGATVEAQSSARIEPCARYAPLAQLVEHLTLNQGVQGSSP